jgi:uridylate kinase
MKHDDAVKYESLTYMQCLSQQLKIMDSTAFSLCMDNKVPILVIDLNDPSAIRKAVTGETIGTLVHG